MRDLKKPSNLLLSIVSGLAGSAEVAQSQVSVGMGLLAGSTVMLLTLIWGTCVIVGKCDLQDSVAIDSQDTKGFSLTGMPFYLSYIQLRCLFVFMHAFIFNGKLILIQGSVMLSKGNKDDVVRNGSRLFDQ